MAKTTNCVFIDFETRSHHSIENGAFAYAADPSTDIICVSYAIEDQPSVVFTIDQKEELSPLLACIEAGYNIVAHNALFEIAIMKYVAIPKYGWPKIKLSQIRCTMQMAGRAGLPLSLDEASKALKITEKLETGKHLIKLFSIPQPNGKFIDVNSRPREKAQFLEYCRVDSLVSREIWRNLPEWKQIELEDIAFDLRSNIDGVPIDSNAARIIHDQVTKEQSQFSTRVAKLTRNRITAMTQVQRIKQWVQQHVSKDIESANAETIQKILDGAYGEIDPVTQEILEMRQHSGKSSTGKYVRYIHSAVEDRICGMQITFGAHTGRAVSKLLNLYNLPKPSVKYTSMEELVYDLVERSPDEVNAIYGSYLKAASTAIRGIITAPKGKILTVADYAAIEARLVFWVSNSFIGLRKYHNNEDLYIDAASGIYHRPKDSINSDQRWVGKQVILGAGFGLGPKGFVLSCARWGVEVPLKLAEEAISTYRDTYPEVVEFWNNLERAAIRACKTGEITYTPDGHISFKTYRTKSGVVMLLMKLPSGRFISYPDVRLETITTPWGAKKQGITYKKVTDGGFFRESTYGGKLTENAVQGIARDIMYHGGKCAKTRGYNILFGVYDELVGMHDEEHADIDEFSQLICTRPSWGETIPLSAEGKICRRYEKL